MAQIDVNIKYTVNLSYNYIKVLIWSNTSDLPLYIAVLRNRYFMWIMLHFQFSLTLFLIHHYQLKHICQYNSNLHDQEPLQSIRYLHLS